MLAKRLASFTIKF